MRHDKRLQKRQLHKVINSCGNKMNKIPSKIWFECKNPYFCTPKNRDDSVAQLVEQYTFNVWVLGPSPSGITNRLLKQTVFLCLIPSQSLSRQISHPPYPLCKGFNLLYCINRPVKYLLHQQPAVQTPQPPTVRCLPAPFPYY